MSESTFTFRVDEKLKAAFAEVAAAQEHTAAQLLRVLMKRTVREWTEGQEHDAWFRAEVAQAVRDADDPSVGRIAHAQVVSSWRDQRAALERRGSGRTA